MLEGYKTYVAAAGLVVVVVVEVGLGVDVPGVTLEDNWMSQLFAALGLVGVGHKIERLVGGRG